MARNSDRRVSLERPSYERRDEFLEAVRRSTALHNDRVTPPSTEEAFARYVEQAHDERRACFFVVENAAGALAGVANISGIVRGAFQSAHLGYYALAPHDGKGYMRAGLVQVVDYAFRQRDLHRVEANIQPDNHKSIRLVRSLGFRREGFSPEYLNIAGRWRDHERWALLEKEWESF